MYRIIFVTKGAYWAIQFLKYGMFWITVHSAIRNDDDTDTPTHIRGTKLVITQFQTFEAGLKYAQDRGIDKAYQRQAANFEADRHENRREVLRNPQLEM